MSVQKLRLLPPDPETCPECATAHEEAAPHNQQSLYWQYQFYGRHGTWPTWEDAMAHCDEETKAAWRAELAALGEL